MSGANIMAARVCFSLALLPMGARGALVTRIIPVQDVHAAAVSSDQAIVDPCVVAYETLYALENAIVEPEAQLWAYNMRRPNFSKRRLFRALNAKFTYSQVKERFYKKLAAWGEMDRVPEPTPQALTRIESISKSLRLVRNMRRRGGVLRCSE